LLLFISVSSAFFHSFIIDYPHFLEGEFGFWTNRLLQAQIGNAGIAGLLAFAGLSVLIIAYNIDFKLPERNSEPKYVVPDTSDADIQLEDEVIYDPVEFNLPNKPGQTTPVNTINTILSKEPAKETIELETEVHQAVTLSPSNDIPFETAQLVNEDLNVSPPLSIEKTEEEQKSSELVEQFGMYDPTLDLSSYKYPTLDLLENHGSNKIAVNAEELEANKNKIVETLNHYNIEIDKIKATIGPTVTLYEIIPAPGVRISKIKNLEDDIALSLAALGIRIIAPMPGKGTIGIEVPNQNPEMVSMRSVLATEKFQNTTMDLPIALGKTISNEVYIADLAKMPHLLVAGATGQGKSVGINAILVSLLYKKHPSQLKFVLVDPKKVELTLFRKIERHFLAKLPGEADAIITDTKKVITTLNSLCIEMDNRYDLLKNGHVRNLKEYNQKFISRKLNPNDGHRFLPFIVLIIDEFADLMMTAGKEVETPIARIAQLARAVGIHLVIATQRPSVNIITGTIKANFPARLDFRVLSKIDSRTILDSGGADQLIGRGDMLLSTGSDLIRIQCAFVDTPEVEKVSEFIGSQRGYPSAWMLPEYIDENGDSSAKEFDPSDRDPMFEEAARMIVMHQQGSTSLIQRKLKLGYNRAGRIIDQLEAAHIVGPFEGSKAREVLIPDEYSLEQFLNTLDKD
jgi:S-DNA-T family DNA segregation ATPase FtsK/SpoIIIE